MSNGTFAGKKVDTTVYRNAVAFYLKEIHGIRDESFKLKKINDLLDDDDEKYSQKQYIKKIVCNPDTIDYQSYNIFS